jgi:hypothetical protein
MLRAVLPMNLEYCMRRIGRTWQCYLRRPASDRPLFYEGKSRHEAFSKLLNGVARMARETPGRLWPAAN